MSSSDTSSTPSSTTPLGKDTPLCAQQLIQRMLTTFQDGCEYVSDEKMDLDKLVLTKIKVGKWIEKDWPVYIGVVEELKEDDEKVEEKPHVIITSDDLEL